MIQRLLIGGFLLSLLCGSCERQTRTEEIPDNSSIQSSPQESDSFFDSLRSVSFFTDSQFASFYKEDTARWYLVTDLLNYYYSLLWAENPENGEFIFDDRVVENRLKRAPAYWVVPQTGTTDQRYKALWQQTERLADFPIDHPEEVVYRDGLKRFMERYLALQCKRLLDELPKSAALTRALNDEQMAWRSYVRAETAFFEELNKISNPDRYSELGIKKGEFLDVRRKRREEADRITYFTFTSSSYSLSHSDYVTWAETQQEYTALQGRLFATGANALRASLIKESNAWFAFAKARTAVEDLLGGPEKLTYMTGTRILKKYHLNDLKSW